MLNSKDRGFCLNSLQDEAKHIFLEKFSSGQYKTEQLKCLCGKMNDLLVAKFDRYGIPINTLICKNCGLMRSSPYYTSDTLINFYKEEYRPLYVSNSTCSESKFLQRTLYGENIYNKIKKYIKLKHNKVFEIGCGSGGILNAFKKIGFTVYGCDYAVDYVQYAKSNNINIDIGSYETLTKYGQADCLILSQLLEHIPNPIDFLKSIKCLLDKTSILYIEVPLIENIANIYNYDIFSYLQNAHVFYYSIDTLKELLKNSGYKIIKAEVGVRQNEFGYVICRVNGKCSNDKYCTKNHFDSVIKKINNFENKYKSKKHQKDRMKICIFGIKISWRIKHKGG